MLQEDNERNKVEVTKRSIQDTDASCLRVKGNMLLLQKSKRKILSNTTLPAISLEGAVIQQAK